MTTNPPPIEHARSTAITDEPGPALAPWTSNANPWTFAEALLKTPGRLVWATRHLEAGKLFAGLALLGALCLAAYGLTVGLFRGGHQLWAAPVKIALGAFATGLICLPSLFIFACLGGADARLREILGTLMGLLALMSLLLLGFAPVSWIFGQSTDSVGFMAGLHIVLWGIGVRYGLRYARQAFALLYGTAARPLIAWSVVFILVGLQMMTTLRPIVGTSDRFLTNEKKFFLVHWGEVLWDD